MVRTTDTSRLLNSTARTGRVLGNVSDLDQDIVLLQLRERDLLDRGSLTLRVLRDMSSSVRYGMTRERLWSRESAGGLRTGPRRGHASFREFRETSCVQAIWLWVWSVVMYQGMRRVGMYSMEKQIDRSNLIYTQLAKLGGIISVDESSHYVSEEQVPIDRL